MYFAYFPKGTYDLAGDGNTKLVTDLMRRIKIRSKVQSISALYDLYDVKEGETPEIVALKHFGSPMYHWVILLTNNVTDRYYDWPLSTYELEQYLTDKYENPDSIHHYEIDQLSGSIKSNGPSDYTMKIQVDPIDFPLAVAVTNREYEQRIQDQKRQIKLLDPAYLQILMEEFKKIMGK
jgi:hypothetical protein